MIIAPVFALLLAAPASPQPLTELHKRDIGCVAVLGIVADEQRRGVAGSKAYPNVRESGRRWAGMVGARVMEESGQPQELVAFAIKAAVEAEAARARQSSDPPALLGARVAECVPQMEAELGAADGVVTAATKPVEFASDEPDTIMLYRQQLGEDLASPQRIRYCDGMIAAARLEIVGREGFDSRDAMAFGRLELALESKVLSMRVGGTPQGETTDQMFDAVKTRADMEQQIARCVRLAESLALALPPE